MLTPARAGEILVAGSIPLFLAPRLFEGASYPGLLLIAEFGGGENEVGELPVRWRATSLEIQEKPIKGAAS